MTRPAEHKGLELGSSHVQPHARHSMHSTMASAKRGLGACPASTPAGQAPGPPCEARDWRGSRDVLPPQGSQTHPPHALDQVWKTAKSWSLPPNGAEGHLVNLNLRYKKGVWGALVLCLCVPRCSALMFVMVQGTWQGKQWQGAGVPKMLLLWGCCGLGVGGPVCVGAPSLFFLRVVDTWGRDGVGIGPLPPSGRLLGACWVPC